MRTAAFDLNEYAKAINQNNPRVTAIWLLENARTMNEDMFFDSANDWGGLDPEHLLALRAVAPAGVFTAKAAKTYISAVGDDHELAKFAPALFGSDVDLIHKLPLSHAAVKPQIIALVRIAYDHQIRLADSRLPSV